MLWASLSGLVMMHCFLLLFPQYIQHAQLIMVDAVTFASWLLSLKVTAVLVPPVSTYSQMARLAYQVGLLTFCSIWVSNPHSLLLTGL